MLEENKYVHSLENQFKLLKTYYPNAELIESYIKLPIRLKGEIAQKWSHSEFNTYFDANGAMYGQDPCFYTDVNIRLYYGGFPSMSDWCGWKHGWVPKEVKQIFYNHLRTWNPYRDTIFNWVKSVIEGRFRAIR